MWYKIQECACFVAGVRNGLWELDEGKGIPHDRVREEFAEWLTDCLGPPLLGSTSRTSLLKSLKIILPHHILRQGVMKVVS